MGVFIRRMKSLTRRQAIGAILAVVAIAALGWAIKTFRGYFFPHRFYVVESGAIYRGSRQTLRITRKIIEKHHIRTIINLDDKVLERENVDRPDADPYADEKGIAKEGGLQYYGFLWQGSGIGPYQEYDAVADILATTSSRPIFLHCAAGEKRTNAALAAYWLRHRGYTLEQAIKGLRPYGLSPSRKPAFMEHLRGYYEYVKSNPKPSGLPSPPPKGQ